MIVAYFFLFDSVQVRSRRDSPEIVYALTDFLPATFAAFPRSKFGGFVVLLLAYFNLFSDIGYALLIIAATFDEFRTGDVSLCQIRLY